MLSCEHTEIYKVLDELYKEVVQHGAWFHPNVEIKEENRNLKVTASSPASPREKLFQTPESCLPPIEKFDLAVEDGDIAIHGAGGDVLESHVRSCELMVELYNHCRKLDEFKTTSPWFVLADYRDLLELLVRGREKAPKVQNYHELWKQGNLDQLMLDGFLGRRYFNLRSKRYDESVRVLHPFIDFLNHHSTVPGYQVANNEKEQMLWTFNSQPVAGSNECLVHYTRFDPFDSLLTYGFVDESSQICRSVPVETTLKGGLNLEIDSRVAVFQGKIPEGLKDLRIYMPQILQLNKDRIRISHILIPGPRAPRSLRRILVSLIRSARPDVARTELRDMVLAAEKEIVDNNLKYYNELLEMCKIKENAGVPTQYLGMIEQMGQRQKDWVLEYKMRQNIA